MQNPTTTFPASLRLAKCSRGSGAATALEYTAKTSAAATAARTIADATTWPLARGVGVDMSSTASFSVAHLSSSFSDPFQLCSAKERLARRYPHTPTRAPPGGSRNDAKARGGDARARSSDVAVDAGEHGGGVRVEKTRRGSA